MTIKKILNLIDGISEWSGRSVAWLLYVLVFAISYDVMMRYLFESPTIWAYDTAYMLYGTVFMIGGAYTLKLKAHIRIDVLFNMFSARGKSIIEIVYYLVIFFPLIVILFKCGLDQFLESIKYHEVSQYSPWRPIVYPYKGIIPLAFLLLGLQGIAEFIRHLKIFIKEGER